jgi:hypothetical protein
MTIKILSETKGNIEYFKIKLFSLVVLKYFTYDYNGCIMPKNIRQHYYK